MDQHTTDDHADGLAMQGQLFLEPAAAPGAGGLVFPEGVGRHVGQWLARGLLAPLLLAAAWFAPGHTQAQSASPIFGVTIPEGYRNWALVAVSHETDPLNELRGILGNPLAQQAFAGGTLPFPDGTILAKLAWKHVPSTEFPAAFVPGAATTVQIMVKNSKRYPDTGGWGFGRFIGGVAVDEAQHKTCFACHQALVKDHDFVFTRIAP